MKHLRLVQAKMRDPSFPASNKEAPSRCILIPLIDTTLHVEFLRSVNHAHQGSPVIVIAFAITIPGVVLYLDGSLAADFTISTFHLTQDFILNSEPRWNPRRVLIPQAEPSVTIIPTRPRNLFCIRPIDPKASSKIVFVFTEITHDERPRNSDCSAVPFVAYRRKRLRYRAIFRFTRRRPQDRNPLWMLLGIIRRQPSRNRGRSTTSGHCCRGRHPLTASH